MARQRFGQDLRRVWRWLVGGCAIAVLALQLTGPATAVQPVQSALTPQALSMATGQTELLWYGQAAFRITTPSGKVILIDPWLQNPLNANGAEDLANLDRADLILITHGHNDHVGDAKAIAERTQAKLVSTFDLGRALAATGGYPGDLVEFNYQGNFGGEIPLLDGDVTVAFIPAVHSSAIATDGSPAAYAGNPGGFVVSVKDGPRIYHTGDTDLFADMAYISQFGKIDWMLACIGGKFTMGPERAAEAVKLVNPSVVVPMHFGVFSLPGTPEQFAAALRASGSTAQLRMMAVDEPVMI
jgi:L-ascorbate metabolism protein UlaG (beta-lactamase superfamily)